jgi:pullulanase/glycogen debranching enzyme
VILLSQTKKRKKNMSSAKTVLVLGSLLGVLAQAMAANAIPNAPSALPATLSSVCDAPDFQTILAASPASDKLEARAYWLSRHQMQWSGIKGAGNFKLYHSERAQLQVRTGASVQGADGFIPLAVRTDALAPALAQRYKFVAPGVVLGLASADVPRLPDLLKQELLLVQEDAQGLVMAATRVQIPGVLDDLYASAEQETHLGAEVSAKATRFKLWAPTAQGVSVCVYANGAGPAQTLLPLQMDATTGVWSASATGNRAGQYYRYVVDGVVPGVGLVRNFVTDPYSVSLTTDSLRSYIADLEAPSLQPKGWKNHAVPQRVKAQTDMAVYELHVRDFSINDASVRSSYRGKYMAFTQAQSRGMQHLRSLAKAGMTDVHLLPVFDIATIPESGCAVPKVPQAAPDSEAQQAAVMALASTDCFNWGYDPFHYSAPEGSFATDASDGAKRIIEFRKMVMALHAAGLRVGMDVVYNHTAASGQHGKSVLDRIVPGYYHRLNASGVVERSTCCDNTATEHRMMGKLMVDSVEHWTRHFKIDSFRFDLMAHQPRDVMEVLQARANAAAGRHVHMIGEGWNFGEIANGARFVQASQLSLNGSGIGTFSDRGRDAVRGGSAGDGGEAAVRNQGYINGMFYDPNGKSNATRDDLMRAADMVRVGLAGSLRNYSMLTYQGSVKPLQEIAYGDQPAGYVSQPGEVVNYVENHDNQTLFDNNVYKLPQGTSREDRARVQMLGAAITLFSQGVAYTHAGMEALRSKSMDGNSYDSGDWFNRLDWTFGDNYFGTGAPPKGDNEKNYPLIKPLLADASIRPTAADIRWSRGQFNDLLRLRASSTLFRLSTADDVAKRLRFHNAGTAQNPVVLAAHLNGKNYAGAGFKEVLYFINVDKKAHTLVLPEEQGKPYQLHPVHRAKHAADQLPAREARYAAPTGSFTVPARTAVVYVVR